jgi:hypothetical protein
MTKGRAVLGGTIVAEQEPFFLTLGGPAGQPKKMRMARRNIEAAVD